MKKRYKLLIFDWDGTLMDSTAGIVRAFQNTADDLGLLIPKSKLIRSVIGLNLADQARILFPGIKYDDVEKTFRAYYNDYIQEIDFFPGTIETLHCLRDHGYYLAVATSKYRKNLEELLQKHKLSNCFLTTRCGDDGFPKPQAEMLLTILDELDIDARSALMIGDTEFDMQLANNAGVDAMAVSYGVECKEKLLGYNPVRCIDDISHLQGLLINAY